MQNFQSSFGNFSSTNNPFMNRKLGMVMQGVWMSNFIRLYGSDVNWYAVPMPPPKDRMDRVNTNALNLNTLLIPKGAKHPREAFEFIAFVQRQPNMEQLCMAQRCNSPLNKISERFFAEHPNKYIRLFDKLARSPNAIAPEKVGIWSQIGVELDNAFQVVNLGQQEPKQALDEAQRRLENAWSKYKRQVLAQK
jgi:ABC-type glycerol-3-phosphate transport system substrate-binding protein